MSGRYLRRCALPENLYAEGSPVLIAAGALLEDTKTGSLLMQLKLRSISQKRIQAVTVRVVPQDYEGNPVGEPVERTYENLQVNRGQDFAQKDPVSLSQSAAAMAAVSVQKVIFADGSTWEAEAVVWTPLAGAEKLEDALRTDAQVEEYRTACGPDCAYKPCQERDLWYCTCGAVNHQAETACHHCRRELAALLAIDVSALTAQRAMRIEEAEKAAAAAAAEKAAKRKAGLKKGLTITVLVLLLAAAVAFVATKPDRVLKKAEGLANTGDLMGAVALLDELDRPEKTNYARAGYLEAMEADIWNAIYDEDCVLAMELIRKYTYLNTAEENIAYVQEVCDHDLKDTDSRETTCTEDGFDQKTCTVCGYVHEEIFPAWGHDFSSEITKESTCTEHGEETFTCSVCKTVEKKELDMLPHIYQTSVSKKPTCTETGIQLSVCEVCGDSVEEPIDMVPHTNKESVVLQPTCTATGTKQTKCTVCGKEANRVSIPALGHNHVKSVQTAVTCIADGVDLYSCSRCSDKYTKPVTSTGHSWNPATCTKPKTCKTCGITEGNALGHKWYKSYGDIYCTNSCGQKYKVNITLETKLPHKHEDSSGMIRITEIIPTFTPVLKVNTYGEPVISMKLQVKGKAFPNNEENPYIKCSENFDVSVYDSSGKYLGSGFLSIIGASGSFSETVYFNSPVLYLQNNQTYKLRIESYE